MANHLSLYQLTSRRQTFGRVALKSLPSWSRWILYADPPSNAGNYYPSFQGYDKPPPSQHAMSDGNSTQERTFGYLSTVETAEYGYFGGYLIISNLGRPLEFHCTAPVRPSRAQQILYGPTLEPYLLGEQICGALFGAAKLTPTLVLTDCEAALEARLRAGTPIVYVLGGDAQLAHAEYQSPAREFRVGAYELKLPLGCEIERETVVASLEHLIVHVELTEPFGRIHEAIREAQRIGGRGTNTHDQAA
jgi:hypothetical protein